MDVRPCPKNKKKHHGPVYKSHTWSPNQRKSSLFNCSLGLEDLSFHNQTMRQGSTKFTFVCHIAGVYCPQVRLRTPHCSESLRAVALPVELGAAGRQQDHVNTVEKGKTWPLGIRIEKAQLPLWWIPDRLGRCTDQTPPIHFHL